MNEYISPIIDESFYGYVYRIINLVNNKTYIGQHRIIEGESWDKYYGSGKIILKAIRKYGKNNFAKELVTYANSSRQLNSLEIFFINQEIFNGAGEYNIYHGNSDLQSFVKNLKNSDEEILDWYFNEGLSWPQISDRLNISTSSIFTYIKGKYGSTDDRFREIIPGRNRTGTINSERFNTVFSCKNCGEEFFTMGMGSHLSKCLKDNYPQECAIDECSIILSKKDSIYCWDHYKEITDFSDYFKRFTEDGVKLGGSIASHNRHHLKKEFYSEFCSYCIDHCENNSLDLTVTITAIKNHINDGLNYVKIAEIYRVSTNTSFKWVKLA